LKTEPGYVVLCACNEGMRFGARLNTKEHESGIEKVDIWSCDNCDNLISVQFFKEEAVNEN